MRASRAAGIVIGLLWAGSVFAQGMGTNQVKWNLSLEPAAAYGLAADNIPRRRAT